MAFRTQLRPLILPALLASAAITVAWTNPPSPNTAASIEVGEEEELEDIMHGIDKNFEAVMAAIEKKDAPGAMELTTKLQQSCISAKTFTPPKLKTVEEKDKPAFIAGYRKQMLTLLKSMADLEIALVDNDFEKAKKVGGDIDAIKKTGHDTYKKMPRKKKE